jgi:hypothetical protein
MKAVHTLQWWVGLLLALIGLGAASYATTWEFEAQIFPVLIGGCIVLFAGLHTITGLRSRNPGEEIADEDPIDWQSPRLWKVLIWIVSFYVLVPLVGLRAGVIIYIPLFMYAELRRPWLGLIIALIVWAFIQFVLIGGIGIAFPDPYVADWLGL